MNFQKFYRLKIWYKNMGIALIGLLSAPTVDLVSSGIGLLQIFLIQTHSFGMNNYYDAIKWNENNYTKQLLDSGFSQRKIVIMCLLPLGMALCLYAFTGMFTGLLVLYAALFYLYQGKPRLKTHWIYSIPLNSIPLGFIIYAHPYLMTGSPITSTFVFFSALFTLYLCFFEIAHQLEHQDEETQVFSIVDRFSADKSLYIASVVQTLPAIIGLGLYLFWNLPAYLPAISSCFSTIRTVKTVRLRESQQYGMIRGSWHKFYTAFEGLFYVVGLLAASTI